MKRKIRTKEDVQFHSEGFGPGRPTVNVKVYDSINEVKLPLALSQSSKDGGKTFETNYSDPEFTVEWIEANLTEQDIEEFWQLALEDGWQILQEEAERIFDDTNIKVYSEGRSGGWAVVEGIKDFEDWDAVDLSKWRAFANYARAVADDSPHRCLDLVYANVFEIERDKTPERKSIEAWAKWIEGYGAEKFLESFLNHAQGAISVCVYCHEEIALDIIEGGGVADWGMNGDYGCSESPDTSEEGTGGHKARGAKR